MAETSGKPLPESVRELPLGDLSALAEVVGEAKVVAIGENNHYVREFGRWRDEVLRFLVTELGFSVLAYESGFAEGRLADDWIHGAPGDPETVARHGFTFRFGEPAEVRTMFAWLRQHNAAGGQVRFTGLDVPASGGSVAPALAAVRDYLPPEQQPLVDAALKATEPYCGANNSVALARYSDLSQVSRDAATASLANLLSQLEEMGPAPLNRVPTTNRPEGDTTASGPPAEYLIAKHHALGALRLDEHLRELSLLGATSAPAEVTSSRDVYFAETVRLLRELHGPEARIVLMMHNAHAQRVPMELIPGIRAASAGTYLADRLGPDYVAIGVTATDGTTTDTELNERAPQGFDVVAHPAGSPAEGSVEQSVAGREPVLLDLRSTASSPARIRHVTTHLQLDVAAAFDAIACLPQMTPATLTTPSP